MEEPCAVGKRRALAFIMCLHGPALLAIFLKDIQGMNLIFGMGEPNSESMLCVGLYC